MSPWISVVIPVHNRIEQLKRALNSLKRQTYTNFDVTICDDGSTDDIKAVVHDFKQSIPITLIRIDASGAAGRPRSTAARAARGEWLAFLDSDDWWDERRLEFCAKYLREDCDILYHPLRLRDARGNRVMKGLRSVVGEAIKKTPLNHMATRGNPIPTSAVIARSETMKAINYFDSNINTYEDFDAWIRCARIQSNFVFLPRALGCYSLSEDALSRDVLMNIKRQMALFNTHRHAFESQGPMAQASHNYAMGMLHLLNDELPEARHYFQRAYPMKGILRSAKRELIRAALWAKIA